MLIWTHKASKRAQSGYSARKALKCPLKSLIKSEEAPASTCLRYAMRRARPCLASQASFPNSPNTRYQSSIVVPPPCLVLHSQVTHGGTSRVGCWLAYALQQAAAKGHRKWWRLQARFDRNSPNEQSEPDGPSRANTGVDMKGGRGG